MARIKLASPISGIRGKLGGIVFSENRNSKFCKVLTKPAYQNTQKQSYNRAYLAIVRGQWRACTQGQIDDWNALALSPPEIDYNAFGDVVLLTGSQWHTRINMRRLNISYGVENDVPVNAAQSPPDSFGLEVYETAYGAKTDLMLFTEFDFDTTIFILMLSSTFSPNAQNVERNFLFTDASIAPTGSSYDITGYLEPLFGTLQAGTAIFGRLYRQSTDGIRSLPLITSTIVQPAP